MRLAWFSPWPPQSSGIAGRSAEVVPALAARGHGIDVFVDEQAVPVSRAGDGPPEPGVVRTESAHEFVWRRRRGQYDLAVYQLGNSRLHDFIWPYALAVPGLVVLHDSRVHHARGHARLSRHQIDRYRQEFAAAQPDLPIEAAELGVRGFDGAYYYQWPMIADLVAQARLTVSHAQGAADELARSWPEAPTGYVPLGEGRETPTSAQHRDATRRSVGVDPSHVLVGVFGGATDEKRVVPIVRAFASTVTRAPEARLLFCGASGGRADLRQVVQTCGLDGHVIWVDAPNDQRFDDLIAAVDVSLHLRWPTALETSGPWLRALAAGRATVITDLPHLAHLPVIDPRDWRTPRRPAVAVAIDILDEDHSLRLALRRLATDAELRAALGQAGRSHWEATHTLAHMVEGYVQAIDRAIAQPMRPAAAAGALMTAGARAALTGFGEDTCRFD